MHVLWKIGQGFAADLIANFPEPKPAYNTVLTIVRILEKKGFVLHETFGKANRYYPLVSKERYSEEFMQHFVRNYFDNSFKSMVSFFANNQDITLEELDDIVTLRRSNLFRLRRFYLIGTLIVSMIIPFVSIETKAPQAARVSAYVQQIQVPEETAVPQMEVQEAPTEPVQAATPSPSPTDPVAVTSYWNWKDVLPTIYIVGCAFAFILLVVKLIKTSSYYRRSTISEELSSDGMRVRVLAEPDGNLPFSFLRSVFVNPDVFTDGELRQVLAHECAHIRQRHTYDLLFMEVLKVLQWFNPIIYFYMRELRTVHEYLADEQVLAHGAPKRDYLELLYKQLCVGKFLPVGNSFRHLLTKKRILMMNQPVKRRVSAWWLLALVPIIAGLLLVNCHPKTEEFADGM